MSFHWKKQHTSRYHMQSLFFILICLYSVSKTKTAKQNGLNINLLISYSIFHEFLHHRLPNLWLNQFINNYWPCLIEMPCNLQNLFFQEIHVQCHCRNYNVIFGLKYHFFSPNTLTYYFPMFLAKCIAYDAFRLVFHGNISFKLLYVLPNAVNFLLLFIHILQNRWISLTFRKTN